MYVVVVASDGRETRTEYRTEAAAKRMHALLVAHGVHCWVARA